jgi:prevent-host-death family protein
MYKANVKVGLMKSITATEAKNNFGDLLMNAQSSPVVITRNGKEQGILLSIIEYSKLKHQAMQGAISEGVESGFEYCARKIRVDKLIT